jgi:hypothetical protein
VYIILGAAFDSKAIQIQVCIKREPSHYCADLNMMHAFWWQSCSTILRIAFGGRWCRWVNSRAILERDAILSRAILHARTHVRINFLCEIRL